MVRQSEILAYMIDNGNKYETIKHLARTFNVSRRQISQRIASLENIMESHFVIFNEHYVKIFRIKPDDLDAIRRQRWNG